MVQTLYTDPTSNDLVLNAGGSLTLLTGVQAVAAACGTACKTQLGECVLQAGQGLPNFSVLWSGVPDFGLWQSYLQATILNVEGVTAVNSLHLRRQQNTLVYTAEIETVYGPTTVAGGVNG